MLEQEAVDPRGARPDRRDRRGSRPRPPPTPRMIRATASARPRAVSSSHPGRDEDDRLAEIGLLHQQQGDQPGEDAPTAARPAGSRPCSLSDSSQAMVTMNSGFRNSDGWNWAKPTPSQRRAPFISAPKIGTRHEQAGEQQAAPSRHSRRAVSLGQHRDADHHRHGRPRSRSAGGRNNRAARTSGPRPNNAGPRRARRRRPRSGRSRSAPRRGRAGRCRSPRTSGPTRAPVGAAEARARSCSCGSDAAPALMPRPPPRRGRRRRALHSP